MMQFDGIDRFDNLTIQEIMPSTTLGRHCYVTVVASGVLRSVRVPMPEVARLHAYLGEVLAQQGAKP